jgi:hypothetical protein
VWADWSQAQPSRVADTLVINAVIYTELLVAFERIEELEAVIAEVSLAWNRFLAKRCSSPEKHFSITSGAGESGTACCPTSTLARTLPSRAIRLFVAT